MKGEIRLNALLLTLFVVVGASASPSHAAFEWLRLVMYDCNPPGIENHDVWRVYAEFSDPDDRLSAVFGGPSSPATITASNGFYQSPFGGNIAPDAAIVGIVPSVAWDTFCTIGLAVDVKSSDQTLTTPGFPPLPVTNQTSMSWFVPASAIEQGAPDASGRVLIMQLTVPDGSSITNCKVGITYRPAGSKNSVSVFNQSPILLALAAGDLNSDLTVDVDDLLMVINTWGGSGAGIADPTDDGKVDTDDLLLVLNQWGSQFKLCN